MIPNDFRPEESSPASANSLSGDVTPPPLREITLPPRPRDTPAVPGYEILGELGKGGMGVVYEARHVALNRVVALKLILSGIHADDREIARFRAEAESIAKLQHPNVVQIFEIGTHDGSPYFSLEYCGGGNLAARLAGKRPEPSAAAELTRVVASAVAHAHGRGIVHRDLKPANVLLTEGGEVKVGDFGLAKEFGAERGRTVSGAIVGTPSYMAPEQAGGGKHVGPPADVCALGVMLYEMLAGKLPFAGGNVLEILAAVRTHEPTPPSRLAAVPFDLQTVCLKCLEKEPSRRYPGARELADDLTRFLAGEPVAARPVARAERAWRWLRRRPVEALASALSLLVLAGSIAAAVSWRGLVEANRTADEERRQKALAQREKEQAESVTAAAFTSVVRKHGVLQGIGELSEGQAARMHHKFVVYRRGQVVERVEMTRGNGHLLPMSCAAPLSGERDYFPALLAHRWTVRYAYAQDGSLAEESFRDSDDRALWLLRYSTPGRAEYRFYQTPGAEPEAFDVEIDRDEAGHDREVWRRGGRGREKGVRYDFGAVGLPRRIARLDSAGHPLESEELEYDRGRLVGRAEFDGAGKPAGAIHRWKLELDDRGRVVGWENFGVDGGPVAVKGYDRVAANYDDDLPVEFRRYACGRLPIGPRAPFPAVRETLRYRQGKIAERRGYVVNPRGDFAVQWREDGDGNRLETRHYDSNGTPALVPGEGWHVARNRYDDRGNHCGTAYFDTDDRSVAHSQFGQHRWAAEFDGKLPLEFRNFGIDQKPVVQSLGFHGVRHRYDDRGNRMEQVWFDERDRPVMTREGRAKVTFEYEGEGTTRVDSWGVDPKGRFYLVGAVDGQGRALERAEFDLRTGEPLLTAEGFHRLRWKYDGEGRQRDWAAFDADGKPLAVRTRVARISAKAKAIRQAGLRAGDTLLSLDGQTVGDPTQFDRLCAASRGEGRELKVLRDGRELTVRCALASDSIETTACALPSAK